MNKESKKEVNRGGRPRKADPAVHRYGFKLNAEEKGRFEQEFDKSGLSEKAKFIKAKLFDKPLKVVKIDKAATDYYIRLTNFYRQFQAVGNNYNQTVRAIKSNFGEKRALAMLYKLEKTTIELIVLNKKIVELTKEFEEKHLKK